MIEGHSLEQLRALREEPAVARLRILEQEQCLLARRTVPKINQGREPGEGTTSKRPADAGGPGTVY